MWFEWSFHALCAYCILATDANIIYNYIFKWLKIAGFVEQKYSQRMECISTPPSLYGFQKSDYKAQYCGSQLHDTNSILGCLNTLSKCWVSNDDHIIWGKCYYCFSASFAPLLTQSQWHLLAQVLYFHPVKQTQFDLDRSMIGKVEKVGWGACLLGAGMITSLEYYVYHPYLPQLHIRLSQKKKKNASGGTHYIMDSFFVLRIWLWYQKTILVNFTL